jgi:hypothetical protein
MMERPIDEASKTIVRENRNREAVMRYALVTAVQAGPPRTATVNLGGTVYTGVLLATHVTAVVNGGLWIADMGMGRWLGIATMG